MKTVFHSASSRGHANHGWLDAKHSFSFASWHHPERIHFGALRVLNDDLIAAGGGFGMHPHDNMEIITIPLSGAIKHQDSMGNSAIIRQGEIQIMSAGTGILHSEFNPSSKEELSLFQIWIFPNNRNVEPRYQEIKLPENSNNDFTPIVGSKESGAPAWIHQDAKLCITEIEEGQELNYTLELDKGLYCMNIEGQLEINGKVLNQRDAVGVWDSENIEFQAIKKSRLLTIEVPMYEGF